MICTLKQGERSRFVLAAGGWQLLAHSQRTGCNQLPQAGDEVTVTVHLHSFERGKDIWTLTDQERLDLARHHKEQGSALFKTGWYRGASLRYSKCIQYLVGAADSEKHPDDESLGECRKEIQSLRTTALLNLAACHLRFERHHMVIQTCSLVLEVDPRNTKGWYRRAKAQLGMKDFEGARSDLEKARELEPGNQAIADLWRTVEQQEAMQRAKYKEALRTMFN